jgi:hypothetical protein
VPIVWKPGSLNLQEPWGPVQTCVGIALSSIMYYDYIFLYYEYFKFTQNKFFVIRTDAFFIASEIWISHDSDYEDYCLMEHHAV